MERGEMNDDLSDEAAKEHADKYAFVRNKAMMSVGLLMWHECALRAEAQIEERVKCAKLEAFDEGYQAAMAEEEVQVEQARTEAFEAGPDGRERIVQVPDTDEAY